MARDARNAIHTRDDLAQPVLQLMQDWIRGMGRIDEAETQQELDHAVDETFPASDPIAPTALAERIAKMHTLQCTITRETLLLAWVDETTAAADDDPERFHQATVEGVDARDGERLVLRLRVDREVLGAFPAEHLEGGGLSRPMAGRPASARQ